LIEYQPKNSQEMKNILVPVDFSKGSMHALEHAIKMINKIGGDLRILHVRKSKSYDQPFILKGSEKNYSKTVDEFCNEILSHYKEQYKGNGTFDYVITTGKIYKNVINEAKKIDAGLVVMGTHGVSGFEELWVGSNSYRVVSKASCPVLTIRHGFKKTNISKIILPIDVYKNTRQKVPIVAELAEKFKAEVHVVDVRTSDSKDIIYRLKKYGDQAFEYIDKQGIKTIRKSKKGSNIVDVVIAYGCHINADLIAITKLDRGTPGNQSISSAAQQMVNHSPVPVLSITPS
jgi:nucleotide-binding universal stress UspA family protein